MYNATVETYNFTSNPNFTKRSDLYITTTSAIWTGEQEQTHNILSGLMILLWEQPDFAPEQFLSMVLLEDLVPPLQLHLDAPNH
jgi:hypothetical protein